MSTLQSPESLLCVCSSPHTQVFIRASMEVTLPRITDLHPEVVMVNIKCSHQLG